MRVDVHFHTCLSKNIPFDHDFFGQAAQRAREQGMFAIIITDHFDGSGYEGIYPALDERYPYNGAYYLVNGVRFYPGVEVEVKEGPHLLVSGTRDDVLAFYHRVRDHRTSETLVTLPEFFAKQAGLDLMNIFAHPFRPKRELTRVDPSLIARFDGLDLNAKDIWRFGETARTQVELAGQAFDCPVVAGSDTHHFWQLGSIYNEFYRPFETIAELRSRIREGAYRIHIRAELADWVEQAQRAKRHIKATRYGIESSLFD